MSQVQTVQDMEAKQSTGDQEVNHAALLDLDRYQPSHIIQGQVEDQPGLTYSKGDVEEAIYAQMADPGCQAS